MPLQARSRLAAARTDHSLLILVPQGQVSEANGVPEADDRVLLLREGCSTAHEAQLSRDRTAWGAAWSLRARSGKRACCELCGGSVCVRGRHAPASSALPKPMVAATGAEAARVAGAAGEKAAGELIRNRAMRKGDGWC